MRPQKLLSRIVAGSTTNVRFDEFCALREALGFEHDRSRGSHLLYYHPTVRERLTAQPLQGGDATPYQVRQLLRLVERCGATQSDPVTAPRARLRCVAGSVTGPCAGVSQFRGPG